MSEETMTLSDDQLEQIGRYVQKNLPEWLRTLPPQTVQITDPALLERTVRVEEELRAQRELMIERFDAVDKRFEAVDRRFEELLEHSKQQFAAVDKRFEAVDKRFEEQREHSKQQFAAVDKRFEDMHKHFSRAEWLLGILVTMFMGLTTAIQIFG